MLFFSAEDCAMDHAVSRRPLTAKAWVHSLVVLCGIYGAQNNTGTVFFFQSTSVLPSQYLSPIIYVVFVSLHGNQYNVSVMN